MRALLLLALLSILSECASTASTKVGNLYKALGLPKDCSQAEIKKAYRRQALRHHPDKVPASEREKAAEQFKKIGRAYEVLSDDKRRGWYDEYGEAALEQNFNPDLAKMGGFGGGAAGAPGGGGGAGGGYQPFPFPPSGGFKSQDSSSMFGGGGSNMGGGSGAGFGGIDLSELLSGLMGQRPGQQRSAPRGPFGFDSGFGGSGLGQGMGQTQQRQKVYTRPFRCSLEDLADPKGRKKKFKVTNPVINPMTGESVTEQRVYTVDVKPGWKVGTKIKFPARGGFPPMIFVLREKPHPYLKREGDDLLWKCRISKIQSEKGAKLTIPLPDGEILNVLTKEKAPTRSGQRMTVVGKGMPIKGGPQRGDLIIEFQVSEGVEDQ